MKWSINTKTTIVGVVTLAMLSIVGLISLKQAQQSREIAKWISHSHVILNLLNSCRALADTTEDEARSYIETGDAEFLSQYRSHSTELVAQSNQLIEQVGDNPEQTLRAQRIGEACKNEVLICDELIGSYKESAAKARARLAGLLPLLHSLDDRVAETEAEEKHLLAQRSQNFLRTSDNTLLGQGTLLGLSLIMLFLAALLTRRHMQEQQRSQELLKATKLQFTGIFNQAFQQVWILSIDGNLLQANQTALDFIGLTRETEVGRPFGETAWWRNQKENQERFKTALASAARGNLERFEIEATSASGQSALLDFSLKPLLDETQKVSLIMAEGRDITQIKIAQTELKENQVRLDAIVQSLAEGLYQLDTEGRLLFANPVGAKMLGYEISELIGRSMHDVVHASDLNAADCPILQVIKKGGTQNGEDVFRRKDGTLMPVHILSAPLTVDRLIRGAVVTFYDITARKEAQTRANMQYALTNMLSQADSLADAAPQLLQQVCEQIGWDAGAFWLADDDSKSMSLVSLWSTTAVGLDKKPDFLNKKKIVRGEDVAGKVWEQNGPLWVGKGSQSDSRFLAEAIKSGLDNIFAFPVRSDEKVLGVIALLSTDADEPTSTQLQMLNAIASQFGQFIERQQAEDQLRDREMLFQQLVNNIREIFWISSARPGENKVLYVSPAFEEVWGRPVSEVYERANSYFDAIVPEDKERVRQHVMKDMYSGSAIEYRILRPDGTIRWVWGRWTPVMGEDGQPERLVGIVHDISERKEMERRVSEFYSTVSHELRTPLTSIRASLGLLEGGLAGVLSAKATKLVSIARSESDRLIRLINDILDIRKVEAGKLELKLVPVKARKMVELTLQNTTGMATEHGITLTPQIDTEREAQADQDRLIQVLTNLVSNAIKFAPKGSEVIINAKDHGKFCRFSVTDNGPGIAEDQLPKLFGLFQQLDSTDSRPKGGTGLGLAISKAIVEQHGGTIDVDTHVGRGSTFFFDIPAAKQNSRAAANGHDVADERITPDDNEDGDYVLIVEDDEKLTEVLKHLLHSENYRVRIAGSIAEADATISKRVPKVVLLDVHLPDGNGLEWMRRMRESKIADNVPVVVLTGQEADDSYGVPLLVDWLRKPVDVKQLLHALKTSTAPQTSQSGPRVLIVEDDLSTREILVHQLSEVGIKAMEASSGYMALQMVKEHNPDLIILDLGLPGFDGFELVKRLEDSGSKSTPLLVYTSRDLSNADMEKLQLGLSRHLIKSKTSQAEFIDAVRQLLTSVLLPR